MTPVTLAVTSEQRWLGFEMSPQIGDIVTASYDFGCGPVQVTGTYEGVETRGTGEVFVWVREMDGTRYAIPKSFVEDIHVEAASEGLPVTTSVAAPAPVKRHNLHESHHRRSAHGRACARLDYEGAML